MKRITVRIKRSGLAIEVFNAAVLQESTTHYLAIWGDPDEGDHNHNGEWFAKQSKNVSCKEIA